MELYLYFPYMSSWRGQGNFIFTFTILPGIKLIFEERTVPELVKEFPTFTETEGLLLCFQEPTIGAHHKPIN